MYRSSAVAARSVFCSVASFVTSARHAAGSSGCSFAFFCSDERDVPPLDRVERLCISVGDPARAGADTEEDEAEREHEGEEDEDPLRVAPQAAEEELVLPALVLDPALRLRRRLRRGYARAFAAGRRLRCCVPRAMRPLLAGSGWCRPRSSRAPGPASRRRRPRATGSSTGSYGLPASETTVRSACLPGVNVPISSSSPSARAPPIVASLSASSASARPGAARGRAPCTRRRGAPRRGRTRASRRASRCRARPAARRREAGRAARSRSRGARSSAGSGRRRRLVGEELDLVLVEVDAMRGGDARSEEPPPARELAIAVGGRARRPQRARARARPPASVSLSARCVATGSPSETASRYKLERRRVRRVRRDTEPDAVGERAGDAVAVRREARRHLLGARAEHLEVDDRAQAELGARGRGGAGVARVADGRDPRREALRDAEPCDRLHLVEREPGLALDVVREPRAEREPVAEARVDRVLEVRVRVDEARQDRRSLECRSRASAARPRRSVRPPRRPRVRERRPVDRAAPSRRRAVGHDSSAGFARAASGGRAAPRARSTPRRGSPAAASRRRRRHGVDARAARPRGRRRGSSRCGGSSAAGRVETMPSRVSPRTKIGSSKTSAIASSHVRAEREERPRLDLQVVDRAVVAERKCSAAGSTTK